MKVLHVLGALRPSGAERMLACSYGDWRRGGCEPEIVAMSDWVGAFTANLVDAGYPIHQLPSARSLPGLLSFVALLRRTRPDVVHLHAERAFLYLALLARVVAPAAVIVRTVHSTFCWRGRLHRRRRRRVTLSRLARLHWVACGPEVAENERTRYCNPCDVVENWVDVAAIRQVDGEAVAEVRRSLALRADAIGVLIVGNCAEVKNHELVLATLGRVRRSVDLLHVGQEEDATSEERCLWHTVPNRHRLLRLGQRDDVPALLASSQALLLPSRREGFSLVAAEALVAGTPVVVSDVSGLRWLADQPGVFVLPPEVEAWAALLESVPLRPDDAGPHSALGGAGPDERFSARRGVRQYVQIYQHAGRRAARRGQAQ